MLKYLLAAYLFFLPFQWALSPFEGVDLALSRLFALLVFLLWAAESFRKQKIIFPFPLPLFLFLSFLLIASLSFLWADRSAWTFRKILFLWNFFPLLFVFTSLLRDPETKKTLSRSFFWGAFLASCVGVGQFLLQFPLGVGKAFALWTGHILPFFLGSSFGEAVAAYPSLLVNISGVTLMRSSAFFPDPHMCAFYLGMALPLGILFWKESDGRMRKIYLFATIFIFLADLLTFSRGGYLGILSGLVSVLLLKPALLKKGFSPLLLSILLPALMLVFFLSPVGNRLLSIFSSEDGSNIERLRLWEEAAVSIGKHPFGGVGLGNYPLAVKPDAEYREPIYAHNLFLDVSVELGLGAAFLFFALFFLALTRNYSAWKRTGKLEYLALFASLMIFFGHSLFETPLFSVHVLPMLLFFLGWSIAHVSYKTNVV